MTLNVADLKRRAERVGKDDFAYERASEVLALIALAEQLKAALEGCAHMAGELTLVLDRCANDDDDLSSLRQYAGCGANAIDTLAAAKEAGL